MMGEAKRKRGKPRMHTKDVLAAELRKAGLDQMADQAATGYYHDFLSPLDTPCLQLAADLHSAGTPAALALRERHLNGEFDANADESEAWAEGQEGHDAMALVTPPKSEPHRQLGRLALRQEGTSWNAYYALPDTMEGAIWLGSIQMRFVAEKARKQAFMDMMREAVADLIEEGCGTRPTWGGEKVAKEHERTKE